MTRITVEFAADAVIRYSEGWGDGGDMCHT